MADRLQLPPLEPEVEPDDLVRVRAEGRTKLVAGMLVVLLVLVGVRGVQLCLAPLDRTVRAAGVQRWDQVTLRARRGEVLDRNGRRLATSVATPNIVVDPARVRPEEVDYLSKRLSRLLDVPADELADKMERDSRYQRLAMRVHPAVAAEVEALGHDALWAERSARRYYPEEQLASQVLGFVNSSGDGQAGLESALDDMLRGGEVLLQRRRDRRGLNVDDPTAWGDQNVGMDVHLTLDRQIQRIAERALGGVEERSEPVAATAVVVDVRTGDVLALANIPTFNPNQLDDDPAPRRNHAVQDVVEAGSVLKPFTVAAAVEEGLVKGSTPIDCEGGLWRVGRTRIHDDHPHGVVSVSEVIKYSSNIGSAKLALRMGAHTFLDYLHDFGFAERTGIQLPGERKGFLRNPDTIKPIELATTSYGQGMTNTPLQLAMATAALANDGVRMKPRLVKRIEDLHGIPEYVQRPAVAKRVVSEATAREVTEMMVTVTEPGGTATRAQVPGYRVAAKTGTAQKVKDGRYSAARVASMMGFVPADDPAVAIVVVVDEPTKGSRYGGTVAGPAFQQIAAGTLRYLGIAPDPALLAEEGQAVASVDEIEVEPDLPTVPPADLVWTGTGWTLPDLRGRPLREAVARLQPAGFALTVTGSGAVVEQQPPAGTPVPPGGEVALRLQ
jgi:cell division protein FtsI (penicillin-binding protein 3)